jgi:RimJ/RimL family protein N-acetyltransferase
MKQYAQDELGLKRLVAVVDPENLPSIRLLEKLGMRYELMVRLSADDIELKLFSIDLKIPE